MNIGLIISSFLAGILTVLAPCILPLLPVIIQGSTGERSLRRLILVTSSLGISIVFFTLLLKSSTILIDVPEIFWNSFSGPIILFYGMFLLFPEIWDFVSLKLGFGQKSLKWLQNSANNDSNWGPIILGASLGPVFSSCSPTYFIILATVLPVSYLLGVFYLSIYSFGLVLTLGLIGHLGQRITVKLKWASNPKGFFKRSLGVLLILVGVSITTGFYKRIEATILDSRFNFSFIEQVLLAGTQTTNDNIDKKSSIVEKYQEYSADNIAEIKKKRINYALFFHADWCLICKKLEQEIISNAEKIPTDIIIFKINFDNSSKIKRKFNVLTQSTVLFFNKKGELISNKVNPKFDEIIQILSEKNNYSSNNKTKQKDREFINNIKSMKKDFVTSKEYYNFLEDQENLKRATFAGGCFWCMEGPFEANSGVIEAFSGYVGGIKQNLTYEEVSTGKTGARQVVDIFYDPRIITYSELLQIYWNQIDPTDIGGNLSIKHSHYSTAIYYRNEKEKQLAENSRKILVYSGHFSQIATKILPFESFYLAEEYHQDFYKKSKNIK